MHTIVSTYSILMPQIQEIHLHIMPETVTHLYQSVGLMVISLLLLPWEQLSLVIG